MHPSEERRIRNERLFRLKNHNLKEVAKSMGISTSSSIGFACECSRLECTQEIKLPVKAFNKIHTRDDAFMVLPGHEQTDIEKVIEKYKNYCVVEKFNQPAIS